MGDNEQYSKEVLICHLSLSLFFLVTLLSHLITLRETVDWSARALLHMREVPSSGLVPKTDFLEVFVSHQALMLLFLSETHTCTALQGLSWLLLVDTELLSSGIKRSGREAGHYLRLVPRLGMIGAVPRLVHTPAVIHQCIIKHRDNFAFTLQQTP